MARSTGRGFVFWCLASLLVLAFTGRPSAALAGLIEYSLVASSPGGTASVFDQTSVVSIDETISSGSSQVGLSVDQPGLVRAYAETSWADGEEDRFYEATGTVSIFDTLVLSGPAGVSNAFVQFTYQVSGALSQTNGDASWSTGAELRGPTSPQGFFMITASANGADTERFGPIGSSLPATLSSAAAPGATNLFPFGVPIDFQWRLFFRATGEGTGSGGSAVADLSNTAIWLGMTVVDGSGNPIDGVELSSTFDYDWLAPAPLVPEPPTTWLLTIAAGSLGLWRSARRGKGSVARH